MLRSTACEPRLSMSLAHHPLSPRVKEATQAHLGPDYNYLSTHRVGVALDDVAAFVLNEGAGQSLHNLGQLALLVQRQLELACEQVPRGAGWATQGKLQWVGVGNGLFAACPHLPLPGATHH